MSNKDNCKGYSSHHHRYRPINPCLLTRTSWFDAQTAWDQIEKGKADGNKSGLWLRARLQDYFYDVGHFIQRNAGKVLFVGLLALVTFCVALKSATMETKIEKLWVEEDGRLENELSYMEKTLGEGFGSTNQLIIQTPRTSDSNILHPNAMLLHLEVMKAATEVTVDLYEVTWRLKDLCYSPSVPLYEESYIDKILEDLFPCAIITPLDCFWEGSKILGPEYPISVPGLPSLNLKWTHLNPQRMIDMMSSVNKIKSGQVSYMAFLEIMNRAGITTAYQEKPCLNISDPGCPSTAPNKISDTQVDVGAELTGGCYGFATKLMHWPEDLIVGGATKNKSGRFLKAKAVQSIVQLMAEQEMFEYWRNHYKVHNIEWSLDKAKLVLEAWQRKFAEEVQKFNNNGEHARELPPQLKGFNLHLFTSTSLMDIMKNFSMINYVKVGISIALMSAYVTLVLTKWNDPLNSQRLLGLAGVLLIAMSVAAGLGFCALLRIPFNASTTQIMPFLAMGLGMYSFFLLVSTYSYNLKLDHHFDEITGQVLKQIGPVILLTSVGTASGFLSAYIIPLPALRTFVLQAAVIIAFMTMSILFLLPAVASLDLRRRRNGRMDLFCCFPVSDTSDVMIGRRDVNLNNDNVTLNDLSSEPNKCLHNQYMPSDKNFALYATTSASRSEGKVHEPFLAMKRSDKLPCPSCEKEANDVENDPESQSKKKVTFTLAQKMSLTYFAREVYGPLLQKKAIKAIVLLTFLLMLLTCLTGIPCVRDGLELTDIVPRGTVEHEFLEVQRKYFNFFNMHAVTQGNFEYPQNQKLLLEYHHAFTRIDKIIKNDDGGLPDFWLTMFRDWLLNLQRIFDGELQSGCVTQEGWNGNATDDAILAYKLLVQTGRVDNPVDKSLVTKVKLVDATGIINPKAFYNYLTAWVSNDALAYSASQASFRPEPKEWTHIARDYELKIPKSQPLKYTQIPFFLHKMNSTEEITATIREIRTICQKYEERGLANFPTGVPFVFWEQYVRLPLYLFSALIFVVAVIWLVISIFLINLNAACFIVTLLVLVVAQLYGLMGLLDVRQSAVPTVILIIAVGIQINVLMPITLSFLTTLGAKNHRMRTSLEHMFSPLFHGVVCTLIGVTMLAFSDFDFITRYFFLVLFGIVTVGALYGLLLLPVLFSLWGPPSEIVPFEYPDRILPPTPPVSPPSQRRLRPPRGQSNQRRTRSSSHSESDDLSTIYEESHSYRSSHEIIVQPELVVETTTITSGHATSTYTTTNVPPTSVSPTTSLPEKLVMESPILMSDRDTPESPISRESPASMSDSSSGMSSMSGHRSVSAPPPGYTNMPQTVTTKVKATAKLKVELHGPYRDRDRDRDRDYSSSSSTNSKRGNKDNKDYYYRSRTNR